jgi:hypothetical protein
MHTKTLALTTAVVASLFMISACNKAATPAAPAAAPVATAATATPPPATAAAPPVTTPAPAPMAAGRAAPMAAGAGGGGMGGGRGMGGRRGMGGGRGMGGERPGMKMRQACAADIAKFCTPEQKPFQCLRPHAAALSQGCQTARAEMKAARQARMAAGGNQ